MSEPDKKKEEIVYNDLKTKTIYYYIDTEKKINQKSREVYKNKDLEIHYPIGYNGGDKYNNTKKFIYEGYKGKLPTGVNKAASRGLGFTKIFKPLMKYLEANFNIYEIKIIKDGNSGFYKNEKGLCFSDVDLRMLYDIFSNQFEKQKQENIKLSNEKLHFLFPDKIELIDYEYVSGSLFSAISTWQNSIDEFSKKDKDAIIQLFEKLAATGYFINSEHLIETKEKIDTQYLDSVIYEFQELSKLKTETTKNEKDWQKFLKKHSWIFSFIFTFPVILFQDEAYVGGKTIENRDGKITDFLVKNDLTDNVAFIEIKTHRTKLLKKGKAYRGTDVFAMSPDLSGAISQVLNQRDNFQKEYFSINNKLGKNENIETFNSKCVIVMGSLGDLKDNQIKSFELLRSNSKDVEIITFDELLKKIELIQQLMKGEPITNETDNP